jgi:hypothetical protein
MKKFTSMKLIGGKSRSKNMLRGLLVLRTFSTKPAKDLLAVVKVLRERQQGSSPIHLPSVFRVPETLSKLRQLHAKGAIPADIVQALNECSFVWNPAARKQHMRLLCLSLYKQIHGDMLVPREFNVPSDDPHWPKETWSLNLGALVHNIRTGSMKLTPAVRQELTVLGFVWDVHDFHWDLYLSALKTYRTIYGHTQVPQRFVIPVDDLHWPIKAMHGLKLGRIVNRLRTQDLSRAQIEELTKIRFVWDAFEAKWDHKISALSTYQIVYGDLMVPKTFVCPHDLIWPVEVRGLKLGSIVQSIRSRGEYHVSKEQRCQLDRLGFVWDPLGTYWDSVVLALKTYNKLYGHWRISTRFIVPANCPEWPQKTWRLNLGSMVCQIRHRGLVMSTDQAELIAMIVLEDT